MAEVELNDVCKYGVKVSVETEQNNLGTKVKFGCTINFNSVFQLGFAHLSEVAVVYVSHHVEQKLLDSSKNLVKI